MRYAIVKIKQRLSRVKVASSVTKEQLMKTAEIFLVNLVISVNLEQLQTYRLSLRKDNWEIFVLQVTYVLLEQDR